MDNLTQKNDLLNGNIFTSLVKFAIPMALSFFLQALYGAVDLVVIGKFCSTPSVSAVATGSQFMYVATTLIIGISTGATVLIAQYIGEKNMDKVNKTIVGLFIVMAFMTVILTLIIFLFAKPITSILKTPNLAYDSTVIYLKICGLGTIFIVAYNAISAIFRGFGDSKSPLLFIFIACIFNIVGDLIFIALFKMDTAGAALATILAQAFSVLFSLIFIKKKGINLKNFKTLFKQNKETKNILKVGFPIAMQDFLTSTSFLIITAIVNVLGVVASSSVGISEKLFIFLSLVPLAFMMALAAFVAQNVGAKQEDRAKKSLYIAIIISYLYSLIMFFLTHFAGDKLAMLFENDMEVINTAKIYLKGTSYEHLLVPVLFCLLGYFNGYKHTKFVLFQGLTSSFLIRIPLSYYFSKINSGNIYYIGVAIPIATSVSLFMCIIYFFYLQKKLKKNSQ